MKAYATEVLETFIAKQGQLFDEPVAETLEEAEIFLEDCMAVVVDSLDDVIAYFDDSGYDVAEMAVDDFLDTPEVFSLPNGKFLIVEG